MGFHEVGRFVDYPVKGIDKIFLQKALFSLGCSTDIF